MRRATLVLVAALGAVTSQQSAPQSAPQSAAERPGLVVMVAVDQLATWVFDAARPHLRGDGGFRRLLDSGVEFGRCAFAHACTETGPGHATLGTGGDGRTHGIVKNEWFDVAAGGKVYCVGDAAGAPQPQFPEGKGRGPARLLVPTVGDLLAAHDAASKIVSVSHKDRSAILMGGRQADAVVWFENTTGRFVTNGLWGASPPEWLLALSAARPADRFFEWTWDRFGPEAAYADCVDDRKFEVPHASSGKATLPVTIRGGRLDEPGPTFWLEAYLSPIANEVVLEAALAALRGAQLGLDDAPDLLCIGFSGTDTVGHYFGPDSVEARDTLLRLDEQLARLFAALDQQVGRGRYAVVLSADHGVGLPPEVARERGLGGGRALLHSRAKAAVDQALRAHFGVEGEGAGPGTFVVHAGEFTLVLARDAIVALRPDADPVATFAEACRVAAAGVASAPGIARGFAVGALLAAGPGDDPIERAIWHSLVAGRSGDVAFVIDPYWLEIGVPASHGTPYPYDREVPLLAAGRGLGRGVRSMATVTPGLCAVLAAEWLGIAAPQAASDKVPDDARLR